MTRRKIHNPRLSIILIIILVLAVPLTIFVARQTQTMRQHAQVVRTQQLNPLLAAICPTPPVCPAGQELVFGSPATGDTSQCPSYSCVGPARLTIEIQLGGIGPVGGNTNPIRQKREAELAFYDETGALVFKKPCLLIYNPSTQLYEGFVDIGTSTTKKYTLFISTKQYLPKGIPGQNDRVITIQPGSTNQTKTTYLTPGDINKDSQINLLDYNVFYSCFENKATTVSCNGNGTMADLDDNGLVNGVDYNILVRSFRSPNR